GRDLPGELVPRDDRQRPGRPVPRRPGRHPQELGRGDGRRADPDQHLARAGPRRRRVLEAERLGAAAGVQSDGFHGAPRGSKGGGGYAVKPEPPLYLGGHRRLSHSSNRVGPLRGLAPSGVRPRASRAAPKYGAWGSGPPVRVPPPAAGARRTNAAIDCASGPASSKVALAGVPTATSARAAATSSAASGCMGAPGRRTAP